MPFQSLMNCAFQASLPSAMLLWHFTQSCCLIGSRVLARLPLLIFLYYYIFDADSLLESLGMQTTVYVYLEKASQASLIVMPVL